MTVFVGLILLSIRMQAAEVHYGLMGLATTDIARLSAYCSEEAPADACELELHFHDIRGQIVKRTVLSLQAGFTGFLDMRPADLGVAGRVSIVPCVFVGRGRVFASARIFDLLTQRQRVMANLADPSQARTGELHFGVSGITAFDTARINAVCADDSRVAVCEVTLIFHLSGGRIVKQATLNLGPGAGVFLDLRSAELGLGLRPGEIIPCVRVGRGAVFATYEMIDAATGFTTLVTYPATAVLP